MARIRVKVVGSGEPGDPFRVDLPTYYMIPGTEEYTGPKGQKKLATVAVEIPADELDKHGRPDPQKLTAKYGEKRWPHQKKSLSV